MREEYFSKTSQFLRSQDPLLLVVGDKGAGKTDLLTKIVQQFRISRHVIRLQGTSNIHPLQLAKMLTDHWAAKIHDRNARIEDQLHDIITGLNKHEQSCLLVIDDAHLLPFSVLAAISHLGVIQECMPVRLHMILSGHFPLINKMQNLQTKDIPFIDLEEPQAADTIAVDPIAPPQSTPAPAIALFKNIENHAIKIFAGITLVIALVFMHWFFRQPTNPLPNAQLHAALGNAKVLPHLPMPQSENTLAHNLLTREKPVITGKNNIAAKITSPQKTTQSVNTKPSQNTVITAKKASPHHLEHVLIAASHNATPSEVMHKLHKSYTLQIMSGDNKAAIEQFIHAHHLENKAHETTKKLYGKTWYSLNYGHYKNYDEAIAAIKKLDPALKKLHPWVKPEHG